MLQYDKISVLDILIKEWRSGNVFNMIADKVMDINKRI